MIRWLKRWWLNRRMERWARKMDRIVVKFRVDTAQARAHLDALCKAEGDRQDGYQIGQGRDTTDEKGDRLEPVRGTHQRGQTN